MKPFLPCSCCCCCCIPCCCCCCCPCCCCCCCTGLTLSALDMTDWLYRLFQARVAHSWRFCQLIRDCSRMDCVISGSSSEESAAASDESSPPGLPSWYFSELGGLILTCGKSNGNLCLVTFSAILSRIVMK